MTVFGKEISLSQQTAENYAAAIKNTISPRKEHRPANASYNKNVAANFF
jgi:hypothetical protein